MKNRGKKLSTVTRKRMMVEAMKQTLHNVTAATRHLGISRTQHYKWLKDDPEYREQIEESLEVSLDFAEAKLRELIAKGNTRAIIFFLESKGKSRGYGLKNHNYRPEAKPKSEFEQMTNEELDQYIKDNE